ncbi:hypothetical protein [Haemophilus haemolyticus]|uniref:hypothetical protein n=1 Tax=Haemophilus haemolyticus TaxID=726 RepID=UPI000E582021|nr:hypothetical protein [Haemophilus haemolyticus]
MDKQIKLRAFEISNKSLSQSSQILVNLKDKLDKSICVNERRMRLNSDDPKQEEDLLSAFQTNKNTLFATMLRIAPGSNIQHIDETLFQKPNLSISDLLSTELNTSAIYKSHYYFALSSQYLVTNLPMTTTITRLQTYINWLLDELFELSPVIELKEEYDLDHVQSFTIRDAEMSTDTKTDANKGKNPEPSSMMKEITNLAMDKIKGLFQHAADYEDIDFSELISAKLVIQLKKVTESTPDEIKKALSATLKPMADLDNISFKTRHGTTVKGSELPKTKSVTVDTTDTGKINEQTLFQQMELFIKELENV